MPDLVKSPEEVKNEERFITALYKDIAGKREDAIKILDTLRREAPNATVYFQLARWFLEKEDYLTTENYLQSAIKWDPSNIWIREFGAEFYSKTGNYDKAIEEYDFLITQKPNNSTYYAKLVNTYIKKGNYTAALETLERQEAQMGKMETIVLRKAEIYDNTDQIDKAIQVLNDFASDRTDEKDYLHLIVNLLKSNDRLKDIKPFLDRILLLDPDDEEAQLDIFLLSNKSPDRNDFLRTLRPMMSNPHVPIDVKIKELMPFVTEHAVSGDSLLGTQLISLMDNLVIAHPNEAKAHAINADILKNSENFNSAIRQYEKTLSLSKKYSIVWEQYMFCLDAVADYTTLVKVAEEAIDYFPNEALFYYFAGKAHFKIKGKNVDSYLNDAEIIGVGNKYVESMVLVTRAEMALLTNDVDKALEWAQKSYDVSEGQNPAASELLGDIAKEQKDKVKATKYYNEALSLGATKARITNKLNSL